MPGSKMELACDLGILLPLERELCPFDLAPVTSTVIQMLFGDTVAIALMQAKHLTRDEYAMNHPAGRIGRRLILRVADVMLSNGDVPVVAPETLVADALAELSSKGCGCVLVADAGLKLQGVFTDGDLRRALQSTMASGGLLTAPISDFMTRAPRTVLASAKAAQAMEVCLGCNCFLFLGGGMVWLGGEGGGGVHGETRLGPLLWRAHALQAPAAHRGWS